MKTILKFLITIIIIAGIAFGIVSLVKKDRSPVYLYTQIAATKNHDNVGNYVNGSNIVQEFEDLIVGQTSSKFDGVKEIINSSEYKAYKAISNNCQKLYDAYSSKVYFVVKNYNSVEDSILQNLKNNINANDELKEIIDAASNYFNTTGESDLDVNYIVNYFSEFLRTYKNKINVYIDLCSKYSNYISNSVYENKCYDIKILVCDMSIKIDRVYFDSIGNEGKDSLLNDCDIFMNKFDNLCNLNSTDINVIKFVEYYKLANKFDEFINSNDKEGFIANTSVIYQVIYENLFVNEVA